MKVIQSLGWYLPDSVGGTEIYVENLTRHLKKLAIDTVITAPCDSEEERRYEYNQTAVYRYPVGISKNGQQIVGKQPHTFFGSFRDWLVKQNASIYHQHSVTYGNGLHHLKLAHELGIKTVLTFHTVGAVCAKGDLRQFETKECDGIINTQRCGACVLHSKGFSMSIAKLVGKIPLRISNAARYAFKPNQLLTALGSRAVIDAHQKELQSLFKVANKVVILNPWFFQILIQNGFPREKIVISQYGTPDLEETNSEKQDKQAFTVAFLGRWEKMKGIHILLKAIRKIPSNIPIRIKVYGSAVSNADSNYEETIKKIACGDKRIVIEGALDRAHILSALRGCDVLAIPSLTCEMGPLVVLEAQAAGIPILASNLGGLRTSLQHRVNGWLVDDYASEDGWKNEILYLAQHPEILTQIKNNLQLDRTMSHVADDMMNLYQSL